jgi:hypothetical protein
MLLERLMWTFPKNQGDLACFTIEEVDLPLFEKDYLDIFFLNQNDYLF